MAAGRRGLPRVVLISPCRLEFLLREVAAALDERHTTDEGDTRRCAAVLDGELRQGGLLSPSSSFREGLVPIRSLSLSLSNSK
jgi:hypothetical protein